MYLSAPIYTLKRRAKRLARHDGVPLHVALDRVAAAEGFARWSQLVAHHRETGAHNAAQRIAAQLRAGDMMLLGARPGEGKTLLALELAALAVAAGRRAAFFTLDYSEVDVLARLDQLVLDAARLRHRMTIDTSDEICADHIVDRLSGVGAGAVVAIDYLQLLDQKRAHPPLDQQVAALSSFARTAGVTLVSISQIDRAFAPGADRSASRLPDLSHVRAPNPFDTAHFNATAFLHGGEVAFLRHA